MEIKKYVRTKDKIYETKDFTLVEDKRFGRMYVNQYGFPFIPKNESDTIEELCDCFVAVGKKHYVWDKQHCLGLTLEQAQSYSTSDFEIYGAFWTDKGLIYVARMNKKGDWELL